MANHHVRPRTAGHSLLRAVVPKHLGGRAPVAGAGALGLAFQLSPTAMIVTDQGLRILAANPAYERLSGLPPSELVGNLPVLEAMPGGATGPGFGVDAVGERPAVVEVVLRRPDGTRRHARMSWARVGGPGGAADRRVATFVETDTHDGELEQWRHRARHDALTGLANREAFAEELERGIARAERHAHRLAVLFIDLDGFKSVNDRLGHAAGDHLLSRVARRLRESLRAEDLVARYAGDEFTVMIEAPRLLRDAATAAESLLEALARGPTDPADIAPPVTASIGIALYPDHAADAAGLLQAADAAMYRAKGAGGNAFELAAPAPQQRSREAA